MFGGLQYSPPSFHKADEEKHTLAALITPRKSKQDKDDSEDSADEEKTEKKKSGVHAIFVADMDMIHDVMFNIWQRQMYDLKLDNVPFVLNCVDYLAGDERFINLRKRQAKHRTLTELERRKKEFEEKRSEEVIEADEEAKKAVEDAQERLNTVLKEIQDEMQKGNVDVGAAQVRLQNATEAENRKLKQQEEEIERAKNERVRHVRIEAEQQIRKIENDVWKWAVMVPPLPAIILGIVVILMSIIKERRGIAKDRLR